MGSCVAHLTALLTGTLEQRTQPVAFPAAFPACRAKRWPYLTREFRAQSCLILVPRQQATCALGSVLLPPQGREANSQPRLLLSVVPRPDHLPSLPRKPRDSLADAGNKASSPVRLFSTSRWYHPQPLASKPGQWPCPKQALTASPTCPRT